MTVVPERSHRGRASCLSSALSFTIPIECRWPEERRPRKHSRQLSLDGQAHGREGMRSIDGLPSRPRLRQAYYETSQTPFTDCR